MYVFLIKSISFDEKANKKKSTFPANLCSCRDDGFEDWESRESFLGPGQLFPIRGHGGRGGLQENIPPPTYRGEWIKYGTGKIHEYSIRNMGEAAKSEK